MVFNADNIWANVQPHARPHEMQWTLTDFAAWRPFFSPVTVPARAGAYTRSDFSST